MSYPVSIMGESVSQNQARWLFAASTEGGLPLVQSDRRVEPKVIRVCERRGWVTNVGDVEAWPNDDACNWILTPAGKDVLERLRRIVGADAITREHILTVLRELEHAYVGLLETGRERILQLGGGCDEVSVMADADPVLRRARALLKQIAKEAV